MPSDFWSRREPGTGKFGALSRIIDELRMPERGPVSQEDPFAGIGPGTPPQTSGYPGIESALTRTIETIPSVAGKAGRGVLENLPELSLALGPAGTRMGSSRGPVLVADKNVLGQALRRTGRVKKITVGEALIEVREALKYARPSKAKTPKGIAAAEKKQVEKLSPLLEGRKPRSDEFKAIIEEAARKYEKTPEEILRLLAKSAKG